MADKGIIFSAPMVRALLNGRKTQTRRLLKPAPFVDHLGNFCAPDRDGKIWNWGQHADGRPCTRNYQAKHVPFTTGDRLYVRENFQLLRIGDYLPTKHQPAEVRFAATDPCADLPADTRGYPWRPCIHMPRWASRLWLAVTDVRVQQLQDCSAADAEAEGVFAHVALYSVDKVFRSERSAIALQYYAKLWNSLHTAEGTTWEANPWVAVISFGVHHGNIDAAPDDSATAEQVRSKQ